jgi:hypothetical protein
MPDPVLLVEDKSVREMLRCKSRSATQILQRRGMKELSISDLGRTVQELRTADSWFEFRIRNICK